MVQPMAQLMGLQMGLLMAWGWEAVKVKQEELLLLVVRRRLRIRRSLLRQIHHRHHRHHLVGLGVRRSRLGWLTRWQMLMLKAMQTLLVKELM
jgi:heme exporter protein D